MEDAAIKNVTTCCRDPFFRIFKYYTPKGKIYVTAARMKLFSHLLFEKTINIKKKHIFISQSRFQITVYVQS